MEARGVMVGLVREAEEEMVAAAAWEEEVVTAATQVMEIRESRLLAEMVDQVLSDSEPATEETEGRAWGFLLLYIEVKRVVTEVSALGEMAAVAETPTLEEQAETEDKEVMGVRAKEEVVEKGAMVELGELVAVEVKEVAEQEVELAVKEDSEELAAAEDLGVAEETRVRGFLRVKKVHAKVDVEVTAAAVDSEGVAVGVEVVELGIPLVSMGTTVNKILIVIH